MKSRSRQGYRLACRKLAESLPTGKVLAGPAQKGKPMSLGPAAFEWKKGRGCLCACALLARQDRSPPLNNIDNNQSLWHCVQQYGSWTEMSHFIFHARYVQIVLVNPFIPYLLVSTTYRPAICPLCIRS